MNMGKELFIEGLRKSYKLTDHGAIKLGLFDLQTLQAGYAKAQKQYTTNKVAVILTHCLQTYKNNSCTIAWPDYYAQIKVAGIDVKDPLIEQPTQTTITPPSTQPKIVTHSKIKILYRDTLAKGLKFLGSMLPPEVILDIQSIISSKVSPYPEFIIQDTKIDSQQTNSPEVIQSQPQDEDRSSKLIFIHEDENGNEVRIER